MQSEAKRSKFFKNSKMQQQTSRKENNENQTKQNNHSHIVCKFCISWFLSFAPQNFIAFLYLECAHSRLNNTNTFLPIFWIRGHWFVVVCIVLDRSGAQFSTTLTMQKIKWKFLRMKSNRIDGNKYQFDFAFNKELHYKRLLTNWICSSAINWNELPI